jgi:hypothetical protein
MAAIDTPACLHAAPGSVKLVFVSMSIPYSSWTACCQFMPNARNVRGMNLKTAVDD